MIREDLHGYLESGEEIVFAGDEAANEGKPGQPYQAAILYFLIFGAIPSVGLIVAWIFGLIHGDSVGLIEAHTRGLEIALAVIAAVCVVAMPTFGKAIEASCVIITNRRLFWAPPVERIQNHEWSGPLSSIIFKEQLAAEVLQQKNSNAKLVFHNPSVFFRLGDVAAPALDQAYVEVKDAAAAYDALPVYLKSTPEELVHLKKMPYSELAQTLDARNKMLDVAK